MEELGEGLKQLSGFAVPWGSNSDKLVRPPGSQAPGDWTTNQRLYMERPMVLATYVAEDGMVGHQWEGRPLVLRRLDAPV